MVGAAVSLRPADAGLGLPLGTFGLPLCWPAGTLGTQLLCAFGAAPDGAVADVGPVGAAFGVHVGHYLIAEGFDLFGAA
jgi:hypothetical protein